jgi:hypothetical protein
MLLAVQEYNSGKQRQHKGVIRTSTEKTMDGFCCKDLHDICFD